jgi:hypothetical protein
VSTRLRGLCPGKRAREQPCVTVAVGPFTRHPKQLDLVCLTAFFVGFMKVKAKGIDTATMNEENATL